MQEFRRAKSYLRLQSGKHSGRSFGRSVTKVTDEEGTPTAKFFDDSSPDTKVTMSLPALLPARSAALLSAGETSANYQAFPGCSDDGVRTWGDDFRGVWDLLFVRISILLIFTPFGYYFYYTGGSPLYVFTTNFLTLIPLAALLGNFTEEIALHTGELIGGLVNATFGNAVEMLLVVQSLRRGLVGVVQGTLLGSILSNVLLVLGTSLWLGGYYHHIQKFNVEGARSNSGLLLLACLSIALPSVYSAAEYEEPPLKVMLIISRVVSIIAAFTYCLFIYFQMWTHKDLFQDRPSLSLTLEEGGDTDDELEESSMSWQTAAIVLLIVTVLTAIHSELLVGAIEGVSESWSIPQEFIGVILLPIVGNACEHLTAVSVAMKDKLDLTLGVAVGSSTQVALFVTPFSVLMGWCLGVPMTLKFPLLEVAIMILSCLIVITIIGEGTSNWLNGVMLVASYLVVAVVFWFAPTKQ
eukprot:GHVR01023298.1.p1 GENE.GHVR01023298.1~~GHVR01023298.1.p1  ORF type:complete len:488 (+),score=98.13 GHVR01023298.1:65-1465(+)